MQGTCKERLINMIKETTTKLVKQYLEELDVLKEKEVNEFLTEENISTARELTKDEDTFESIAQYGIGYIFFC